MEEKKVVVGLCAGRHEMPVSEYIFDTVEPTDFDGMEKTVGTFVLERVGLSTFWRNDEIYVRGNAELIVYVTGLTACTAEVVATCAKNGICLTLIHYNRESGMYEEQYFHFPPALYNYPCW